MSQIGLPKGMTRDDAYVQGMADGEAMAEKPLVLVVQNSGNVVEVFEEVRGKADIIFIDWEEVEARLEEDPECEDCAMDDFLPNMARDVLRLSNEATKNKAIVNEVISSWNELCDEHGVDPFTGWLSEHEDCPAKD